MAEEDRAADDADVDGWCDSADIGDGDRIDGMKNAIVPQVAAMARTAAFLV